MGMRMTASWSGMPRSWPGTHSVPQIRASSTAFAFHPWMTISCASSSIHTVGEPPDLVSGSIPAKFSPIVISCVQPVAG